MPDNASVLDLSVISQEEALKIVTSHYTNTSVLDLSAISQEEALKIVTSYYTNKEIHTLRKELEKVKRELAVLRHEVQVEDHKWTEEDMYTYGDPQKPRPRMVGDNKGADWDGADWDKYAQNLPGKPRKAYPFYADNADAVLRRCGHDPTKPKP